MSNYEFNAGLEKMGKQLLKEALDFLAFPDTKDERSLKEELGKVEVNMESLSFNLDEYLKEISKFAKQQLATNNPQSLQFLKLHIGKEDIANLLGVDISQIAVANVKHNEGDMSTEFTVAIDSSAEVKNEYEVTNDIEHTSNLRRQRIVRQESCMSENIHDMLQNKKQELSNKKELLLEIFKQRGVSTEPVWGQTPSEMQWLYQNYQKALRGIDTLERALCTINNVHEEFANHPDMDIFDN